MLTIYRIIGLTFWGIACAHPEPLPAESEEANSRPTARTSLPQSLAVPAFVPPAPPIEKKIPGMRVDAMVTVPTKAKHTLTIIRGEASTLPDLAIPQETKPQERQPLTPEELAKIETQRGHTLQLGATIYDHRISRVQWTHPASGESYEALCGFDLSLLQGLGQFTHDGESYHLMLTPFLFDTVKPSLQTRRSIPELPEVPPDSITILKGNPKDPLGCATITILKDLITHEKSRLITYQADRLRYQKAAAEWEKAHPTLPRDETVWLRPHQGSRYLANPRPEAAAR